MSAAGPGAAGTLTKIVCGVDGSAAALEGVRQAVGLADAASTIELLAVTDRAGTDKAGLPRPAREPTDARANEALAEARAVVTENRLRVASRSVDAAGSYGWERLLEAAAGADLLVLGRHHFTPVEDVLGGTAPNVVHRAELPVLVAVTPPRGLPFPGRILVAADGPGYPEDAVRLAAAIAERRGSDVVLLRVEDGGDAEAPKVAAAVADLTEATGGRAVEVVTSGRPHRAIAQYAQLESVSLVITGSRGPTSLAGRHSVSERVAHEAPCSVLVVRSVERAFRDLPYA